MTAITRPRDNRKRRDGLGWGRCLFYITYGLYSINNVLDIVSTIAIMASLLISLKANAYFKDTTYSCVKVIFSPDIIRSPYSPNIFSASSDIIASKNDYFDRGLVSSLSISAIRFCNNEIRFSISSMARSMRDCICHIGSNSLVIESICS